MVDQAITGQPLYTSGQDQGHITMNDQFNALAFLARAVIKDIDENDSDATSPSDGDGWYVATGVTAGDAWEGHEGEFAVWYSGWMFIPVTEGMKFSVLDEKKIKVFNSAGAWEDVYGPYT